jgi:hypothetical protein
MDDVIEEVKAAPKSFEEILRGAYNIRLLDMSQPDAPDGMPMEPLTNLESHDLADGRRVYCTFGEVIDGHGEVAGKVLLYFGPVPEHWDELYTGFAVKVE